MCQLLSFLLLSLVMCLVFPRLSRGSPLSPTEDCVHGWTSDYRGSRDYTMSGLPCQRWNETSPHKSKYTPSDGGEHNYCRNPNGNVFGTWCYTTNPNVTLELCRIPKCKPVDSKFLLMASAKAQHTYFSLLPADPVYPKPDPLEPEEHIHTIPYYNVISAIAVDTKKSKLFFSDFAQKCLATYDMKTRHTTYHWPGMAKDVYQFAYDWVAKNIYWTDAATGFLVVADINFRYYTNLEKPPGHAYGVAIHMKRRELYFGLRSRGRGHLVSTDLAGKNPRYLHTNIYTRTFPNVAIDYVKERVYWIDNQYAINYVLSCKLDGTGYRTVEANYHTVFRGLVIHQEAVYVSDIQNHGNPGEMKGRLWLYSKDGRQKEFYNMEVAPRGLLVYGEQQDIRTDELPTIGECHTEPVCGHICLPRFNATRECVCMLGFHKVGDTGCASNAVTDSYMLVGDRAQKKIFQLSLNAEKNAPFSVLPISSEYEQEMVTMAMNIRTETVYWSDASRNKIYSFRNDSEPVVIKEGYHARSLAIDHITGNIYFADGNTGFINVMSDDGAYLKTLINPKKDIHKNSFVRKIALDLKHGHLYWSDHRSNFGEGDIKRMKLDGSNPETVFEKLMVPRAMTIAYERDSLILIVESNKMHEIRLSDLQDLESDPPEKLLHPTRLKLTGNFKEISDILVVNDTLFIADDYHPTIRKYDLSNSLKVGLFGKTMLYQPVTLAAYRSSFTRQYIDVLPNPCSLRHEPCSQLCFTTSATTSRCECEDGWAVDDVKCVKTKVMIDRPPSYGMTCPFNSYVTLKPCQNTTVLTWKPPQWTDDHTATDNLTITSPSVEPMYGPGSYEFLYTATDSTDNKGHCQFTITVIETLCTFNASLLHKDVAATQPHCEAGQYVHYLQCTEPNHHFQEKDFYNKTIKNVCRDNGEWSIPLRLGPPCIGPSTTTAENKQETSKNSTILETSKTQIITWSVAGGVAAVILAVAIYFVFSKCYSMKLRSKSAGKQLAQVLWHKESKSDKSLDYNTYSITDTME